MHGATCINLLRSTNIDAKLIVQSTTNCLGNDYAPKTYVKGYVGTSLIAQASTDYVDTALATQTSKTYVDIVSATQQTALSLIL